MTTICDPWNLRDEIDISTNANMIFIGPRKITKNPDNTIKDIKRYNIDVEIINKNNCKKIIQSKYRTASGYRMFEIKIKNSREAHIENISKNDLYSGSDVMIFVLQILHRLKIEKCSLTDASYYDCKRNNFFKLEEVPLKILKLLKEGNTFYSSFGFNAIDKTNKKNKIENMRKLVGMLYEITWDDLDNIIVNGKNQINASEINNKTLNHNSFLIRNINKWKKYWKAIHSSWISFKSNYEPKSSSPFRAFTYMKIENCHEFVGWLELYSYTFNNFNKVINYTFFNVKYEIPKIRVFNQLKETINNVEWIMNTVVAQQDVFVK